MKNSIGSLAALAACMIPVLADAAPQGSPISNVIIPYGTEDILPFDIDNDDTDDFEIFSNSAYVGIGSLGSTLVTPSTVPFGSTLSTADTSSSFLAIDEIGSPSFTTGYYGFSFVNGSGIHTGWILLDFTGPTKYAVSAAWETTPGASIIVGAIPEPSAAAALAGSFVLLGASALRRRRPSA